jgi:hypothetical protein
MISHENLQQTQAGKYKWLVTFADYILFLCSFILCFIFDCSYNETTSLFNDKLIDVCSIFFGIFIGCLYLFERFRPNTTYTDFLRFCRNLLYVNVLVIAYSFIIILINPSLRDNYEISIKTFVFDIKPKVLLFSTYVSIFSLVIYRIIRFINMILIILKGINA